MSEPIKVLMIEDAIEDAELLVREMRKGGLEFVHERVDTRQGVEGALERFSPDVILCDYSVPGFSGMSALEIASQRRPNTPFIFVSGTIGEERAIEALKRGATDYVLKDNRARLVPSILRALKETEERGDRIRAEHAQRASEERFRSVAEASQEWIWDADAQGLHTYCNHAVAAILGYEPDELVGVSALDYIHQDDRPGVLNRLQKAAADKKGWRELVLRWRHKDGSIRWLESNALPLLGPDGEVVGYRGADRDITDRIEQQKKIARLSRIHAMFSGINSTVVRVTDRKKLLHEACRIAVDAGGFRAAWVGAVDSETRDGEPIATAGLEDGYAAQLRVTTRTGLPHSDHPASRALREKRHIVCNDIATDPAMASLREDALARGYRSLAAFPLVVEGNADEVLVVVSAEPDFFDGEEVELLGRLAADLSFALDYRAKEAKLSYVSYYDTLTGLANRQLFFDRLTQMIHSAHGTPRNLGVIVVDLQRFRTINDTLGRSAGDRVLREFAERLRQTFGEAATPARISSDRFAVALSDLPGASLAFLVQAWTAQSLTQPMIVDGTELRVSFKLGSAIFPTDGSNAETLFRNAEAALQRAKDTADSHVLYSPDMNARVAERLHLESSLRKALELNQLTLHYQPKVDIRTKRILGLEALMRWRDPERGFVSPLEFIPVLEQTGMIVEAGRWVIEKVVADMRRWRALGLAVPRVAVNVSQVQVRRKNFVAEVLSALGDGNDNGGVDLEITESLIMEDAPASIEKLSQLRAAGMCIFMDDFVTGYSSLSQIAALPLDALKIDRAFVAGMDKKAEAMAIVSTIISLARALKIGVVAEGVETEEQASLLAKLGCDQAQGYLFSKPLLFDDIAAKLQAASAES